MSECCNRCGIIITAERIGWLRSVVAEFRECLDQHNDPVSAFEAVRELTMFADDLEKFLPEPPARPVADESAFPF